MTPPSQQAQQFIRHPKWPFLTLRSTYNSTLAYKTHRHDTVSLGVVLDGTTQSTVNGQMQTLHQGDMVLIPNDCPHACNPDGGYRSYHMLYIEKDWCIQLLGGSSEQHSLSVQQAVIKDAALFAQMESWLSHFQDTDAASLSTLSTIIETFAHLELHVVVDLDGIVNSDLSVLQLAQTLGMSKEGFIRAIKRQTGLSPLALRHNQRIEQAKQLIAEGMALIDVALHVGYHDQSQFHKHFVHYTAATPRQYQNSVLRSK